MLIGQLIARLGDRPVRRAISNNADCRLAIGHHFRPRNSRPGGLELLVDPFHITFEVVRTLAVLSLFIVTAASCKICRRRMFRTRQRAIADAITIHILVAGKTTCLLNVRPAQDFSAINRFVGIRERIRHPVVHPEIKVRHDEHRRLEMLGQIKSLLRHCEALADRARKQHEMLGVAVTEKRRREHVALRSASR